MIHHNFYSVCYKETEDSPIDLDPENDPLDSKGCPGFCPKEPTVDCEIVCPNGYSDYFICLDTSHTCDKTQCEPPLALVNGECAHVVHPFDSSSNFTTNDKADENDFLHVGEFVENEN